ERSFLTLDVIAHAVDLREAALPDYVHDLEAALEDVADGVVGGLGRGSHLGRIRFRERLPAAEDGAAPDAPGRSPRSAEGSRRVRRATPGPVESAGTCRIPPTACTRHGCSTYVPTSGGKWNCSMSPME